MMGKAICLTVFLLALSLVSAAPSGGVLTPLSNSTAPADPAGSHAAIAGNVTEMNIYGYTTTAAWQGYYGNVTGVIQLTDGSDNAMFNWTLANPRGEVYASTTNSITWSAIQCFNFTATGADAASCSTSSAGGTCGTGMSLTQLETLYNIGSTDVDGVNETFSLAGTHEHGGGFNHSSFHTNNLLFHAGECPSTHLYSASGINDAYFEEVLLYDPVANVPVFTALIEESSILGFDGKDRDFQMLVLEDGHGTNTATTTYYFYVELN